MRKTYIIVLLIFGLLLTASIVYGFSQKATPAITSYEECVAAGYPIQESYPTRCATPDGQTFTGPITSADGDNPPGSIHNLPVPPGVAAARRALADKLNITEKDILILEAPEKEWPNSCLGLEKADELCAQVITPGFEVTMRAKGREYTYRTT